MELTERAIQAARYAEIARQYDGEHDDPEHHVAFWFLVGMLEHLGATSVLDVGAGAGRVMAEFRRVRPDLHIRGVEPVEALRRAGHEKGIPPEHLTAGDGYKLDFADGAFDVVCEFGVLHHVRHPNTVVQEMLRVARKAVFLSDSNNFGGGGKFARFVKQSIHGLKLWPLANLLKTRGKRYSITAEDGLFYSYSVVDSLPVLRSACPIVHMMNTVPSGPNLYRTSYHLAMFAIKPGSADRKLIARSEATSRR